MICPPRPGHLLSPGALMRLGPGAACNRGHRLCL